MGRAIGISGIDGALIQSKIRQKEMGYVGDVVKVNTAPLEVLLQSGFIQAACPANSNLNKFGCPLSIAGDGFCQVVIRFPPPCTITNGFPCC